MRQFCSRNLVACLAALASLTATSASAQLPVQPDETLPGFRSQNVFESRGLDNVSPFNGDLGIVLPLGPEYTLSSSATWQMKAFYSAKLWRMASGQCLDSPNTHWAYLRGDPTIGVGWTLNPGYFGYESQGDNLAFGYFGPDGAFHFDGNDGSHIRTTVQGSPPFPSATAEFPDGSKHTFDHAFTPLRPPSSPDFTEVTGGVSSFRRRLGLTKIEDSVGTEVLHVNYDDFANPWKVTSISLPTIGQRIDVLWKSYSMLDVDGVHIITWQVVDYIDFPAFGGANRRRVTFGYQPANFVRTNYDTSFGCPTATPVGVAVPSLASVTITDTAGSFSYSYTMSYCPVPVQAVQQQGALQTITLPTGGYITYTYSWTAATGGSPEEGPTIITAPAPKSGTKQGEWQSFLDKSIAVETRCESTGVSPCPTSATTTYARHQYVISCFPVPCEDGYDWDPFRVVRRVEVVSPGNDAGPSPTQYLTRYYFHVASFIDSSYHDGGIELERRQYAGATTAAGVVRDVISCWQSPFGEGGGCGYHNANGDFFMSRFTILPPKQAEVTWYGNSPASSDGGTCPTGSTPCKAAVSSDYDSTVMQFRTTTMTNANLPLGGPARTSFTRWAPWIDATHWFLNLYNEKDETEGSNTIYRGFEFDSGAPGGNRDILAASSVPFKPGFLRGSWISDQPGSPTARSLLLQCSYPDPNGDAKWQFSASYDSTPLNAIGLITPPFTNLCSTFYSHYPGPSIGFNSDAFGHVRLWSHGLLNSDAWVNRGSSDSPATLGWFAFNVSRDASSGLIFSSSDASGVPTSYSYDALGRLTGIFPTGESPTFVCYDSATRTTVYRAASQSGSCPVAGAASDMRTWQQYIYDGFGRIVREIHLIPTLPGPYAFRTHAFDSAGHEVSTSEWQGCAIPASDCQGTVTAGTRTSDFDPLGRPQTVVKADGSTTTVNYNDGAILLSDTRKTVTVRNINGICAAGACSGGTSADTTFFYDAQGRLVKVTEPSGDATTYAYDVNGKLAGVSQGGGAQLRSFVYNSFGFLTSETTPEKGTVDSTGSLAGGGLKFGSLGNVRERTEGYGTEPRTHDYAYDSAGRLLTESVDGVRYLMNCYDGSATVLLCPDSVTANSAGGASPRGKLTLRVGSNPLLASQPAVTDDFTYSGAGGRLSRLSTTVAGGSGPVEQSWFYNDMGVVAQHAHARVTGGSGAPLVVSTTYTAGLPTALYANGIPVVTDVSYAASGALQRYTTGVFPGQTVATTITPDGLLPRPSAIGVSGAVTESLGTYAYDGVGNIRSISGAATGTDTFTYDALSRLTDAALGGLGSQHYHYDLFGNMLDRQLYNQSGGLLSNTIFCVTTCVNNKISPTSGAGYDPRGNLTQSAAEGYGYDPLNRIISSSSGWTYAFAGSGERVVKIPPSPSSAPTYTFRDEGNRISAELSGADPARDDIFLGSQLVGSYANGGMPENTRSWTFYTSDHLGTPRLVTDVAGGIVEHRRYWPYGDQAVPTGLFQRVRFAAMEQDTEAGLNNDRYYDHARSHAAMLARFLSPDALAGHPEDPQTWNRYTYSRDNPTKFVDENGREFGYPGQQADLDRVTRLNFVTRMLADAEPLNPEGAPGEFLIMLFAAGPRAAGEVAVAAVERSTAEEIAQVTINRATGRAVQEDVTAFLGASENHHLVEGVFKGTAGRAKPDIWGELAQFGNGMALTEIKSGAQAYLSRQMGYMLSSYANLRLPVNLIVGLRTTVSGPLQQAIRLTGGRILRWDPIKRVLLPL